MPPDVDAATRRVIATREHIAAMTEDAVRMRVIDDVLCDGYTRALEGDAWQMATEERLHDLLDDASSPARGRELRAIAREHADFQRGVIALRRELEALREERQRLRARSPAGSA